MLYNVFFSARLLHMRPEHKDASGFSFLTRGEHLSVRVLASALGTRLQEESGSKRWVRRWEMPIFFFFFFQRVDSIWAPQEWLNANPSNLFPLEALCTYNSESLTFLIFQLAAVEKNLSAREFPCLEIEPRFPKAWASRDNGLICEQSTSWEKKEK